MIPMNRSLKNSPSRTESQKNSESAPVSSTEVSQPAITPAVSAMMVRGVITMKAANTRGAIRRLTGSVPKARRASTWLESTILPISATILAPVRPATISPVTIGPISRSTEMPTIRPSIALAPKGSSFLPHSRDSTMLTNIAANTTRGRAWLPKIYTWRNVSPR